VKTKANLTPNPNFEIRKQEQEHDMCKKRIQFKVLLCKKKENKTKL
jgi:hypothetical protein